jgi:hypothetical protein
VKTAARVGRTFRIDPMLLLDDADEFRWATRVACHAVIARDDKENADRQKSATRVAGSRRRR